MSNSKSLVTVALMAAVICIIAPFTLSIGPVPISMATFVMYLMVCVFGVKKATASIVVYLVIGFVGVPVFSGYTGGLGQLLSPTGGYIAGYVVMCLVSGMLLKVFEKNGRTSNGKIIYFLKAVLSLIIGTLALYIMGTAWYMVVTGNTLHQALAVCVVPFAIFDIIKIVAAALFGNVLKKRLIVAGINL